MIDFKKLSGGGDTLVSKIYETAATMGLNVIELMWLPRNRQPSQDIVEVIGYKKPIVENDNVSFENLGEVKTWIDTTVKFFPDQSGRQWGFIYDCPENRELLASSLSTNWFRIIDAKIREEIINLAKDKGYETDPISVPSIKTKKTEEERQNENRIKDYENRLRNLEAREKELLRKLEVAKGNKVEYIQKRIVNKETKEDAEEVISENKINISI